MAAILLEAISVIVLSIQLALVKQRCEIGESYLYDNSLVLAEISQNDIVTNEHSVNALTLPLKLVERDTWLWFSLTLGGLIITGAAGLAPLWAPTFCVWLRLQ